MVKSVNFLLLGIFVSYVVIASPVPEPNPTPFDVLTQSNSDPEETNQVLHHMVNAESRVLHLVHPDGTTHAVTLTASPAAAATYHPGMFPVSNSNTLHPNLVSSHVIPGGVGGGEPEHRQLTSNGATGHTLSESNEPAASSHTPPIIAHVADNTIAHPSENKAASTEDHHETGEEHKALGGPLTPHSTTAESSNAKGAEHEGNDKKEEEKKSESGNAEKKAEPEKKPEGGEEKKTEEKKPESGEEKKTEEKKGEEKNPEEGEKKPEESKNSDAFAKKPEDDHANNSLANRDTIIMPLASLVLAAGFALFIL